MDDHSTTEICKYFMSTQVTQTSANKVSFERVRGIYALHVTHDVAQAIVNLGDESQRSVSILEVFRALSEANVPIFLIKLHRTAVTFAVAGTDLQQANQTLEKLGLEVSTIRGLALLVVRASSMRDLHGVVIEIVDALHAVGARLYETGDSHDSVQCLIEADYVKPAIASLTEMFHLDPGAIREESAETEERG